MSAMKKFNCSYSQYHILFYCSPGSLCDCPDNFNLFINSVPDFIFFMLAGNKGFFFLIEGPIKSSHVDGSTNLCAYTYCLPLSSNCDAFPFAFSHIDTSFLILSFISVFGSGSAQKRSFIPLASQSS